MVGEFVGRVTAVGEHSFKIESGADVLHGGDGVCFFDSSGTLHGALVNAVHGQTIIPSTVGGLETGARVYRNHDHVFLTRLKKCRVERNIAVRLRLAETADGVALTAVDEDGNTATGALPGAKEKAQKPEKALATTRKQLQKTGATEFTCTELEIDWQDAYFIPLSALNALRRRTLEQLAAAREQNRPRPRRTISPNSVPFPETQLSYLGNVLNQQAAAFYRRHGVTQVAPAAESGMMMQGQRVMRTRYCIKHQLGLCHREGKVSPLQEPLYLVDEDGHRYELRFDCAACEMEVSF
jgi:putative protease